MHKSVRSIFVKLRHWFACPIIAASVFLPSRPCEAMPAAEPLDRTSIKQRIEAVRKEFRRANPQTLPGDGGDGGGGQPETIGQWYNWPNWPNWGNWPNYWGNWGNWRNAR